MINKIKYIVCCIVGVFLFLPAQSQNVIRPKIAGPGNLWVNSYNGVLFFELTDLETQNSAMPMQLRFYYNSSACKVDYGYGLGFSMGFEMRYQEDVIGGVDIISGDGRIDHFTCYGNEYKAPAGVFSTLSKPTYNTYLLTTKEGDKYFFNNDVHHKITSFEDRYGNITEYKYQDSLLVEIKDAVGHTITLNYTDGLLSQASATFSPGKYRYEYDGLRRLRKRIDPLGNVTLYDYSHQNKIDEIVDANGNRTLIAYNNAGMVSRLKTDISDKSIRYDGDKTVFIDYTEPNNVYSYYRWDDKGRAIEKVGLCCGIQSKQRYDDDDNIARIIDANGNVTIFSYDENGNMIALNDPLGHNEQYTYEPIFNSVSSYRDKNGNTYTFTYDNKGNLTTLNGPLGFNSTYTYNEFGWCTISTDSNGNITRTSYNNDGTISNVINPDGGVIAYSYDSYGRLLSITDAMGNITSYTYDDLGRVTKETDALGHETAKAYDKVGNIVRVMDAAGNITAYTYDILGHVTSETDAKGNVTLYKYDKRGNLISVIDPLGIVQEIIYNDRNKIESITNGEGEKTNYDYDAKGNLIAVMQPNGNVVSYEYDELDHLIEISDNLGLIAVYEYDGNGNLISETDGLNRKTTYLYDALNRVISKVLPSGSKTLYEYDANSNLISKIDALGNSTNYTYDAMNRLISQSEANDATTRFVYDANGNMTRVTDAKGNSTTFSYDAINQNTNVTFANGRSLQYTYDNLGQVSIYKDRAGNELKYIYDANGNLLSTSYPDGSSDHFSYDAINRMTEAINKDATVQFRYDRAGRLINENLNGKNTSYSYDIAAATRTLVYPSGTKVVENLNARNLITSIAKNGEEAVVITYNMSGQKCSVSFANGITTNYGYNDNGWIETISDNNDIINYKIIYDARGNITQRIDMLDDDNTESYSYDNINQLTSFKRGNKASQSFDYDLLGNRVRTMENGIVTNYSSDNVNAYTSITGGRIESLQYDGNGNLIRFGNNVYVYDYNNKLVNVNNGLALYKYDALGRMISKNDINYYYADNQKIEEQFLEQTTSYLFGNHVDDALVMIADENTYAYHTNQIGSVMKISDANKKIVERIVYSPFGKTDIYNGNDISIEQSEVHNSLYFAGREFDSYSNNYYYRARNMSPEIGHFMQHDLLLYGDGLNDYSFVGNNPVNFKDIWGYDRININLNMGSGFGFSQNGGWTPPGPPPTPDPKVAESAAKSATKENGEALLRNQMDDFATKGKVGMKVKQYNFTPKKAYKTLGVLGLLVIAPQVFANESIPNSSDNGIINQNDNNDGGRNPVLDFLIGGCLDLYEQGKDCGWRNAGLGNAAMCALDIIPAGKIAKIGKLGKLAKIAKKTRF